MNFSTYLAYFSFASVFASSKVIFESCSVPFIVAAFGTAFFPCVGNESIPIKVNADAIAFCATFAPVSLKYVFIIASDTMFASYLPIFPIMPLPILAPIIEVIRLTTSGPAIAPTVVTTPIAVYISSLSPSDKSTPIAFSRLSPTADVHSLKLLASGTLNAAITLLVTSIPSLNNLVVATIANCESWEACEICFCWLVIENNVPLKAAAKPLRAAAIAFKFAASALRVAALAIAAASAAVSGTCSYFVTVFPSSSVVSYGSDL